MALGFGPMCTCVELYSTMQAFKESIICKNPDSNFQTEKVGMNYNRIRTLKTLLMWFQAVAGSFLSQVTEQPSPFYGSIVTQLGICTQWGCFHQQGDSFLHLCCVSLEVMTSGEEIILRWVVLMDFLSAKQNHMATQLSLRRRYAR